MNFWIFCFACFFICVTAAPGVAICFQTFLPPSSCRQCSRSFSSAQLVSRMMVMNAKGMSKRAKTGKDKSSAGFKKSEKIVTSKPPEKARSAAEDPAAYLQRIASVFTERSEDIVTSLKTRGYYIGDGLFGESALRTMRAEAIKLRELGLMTVGKSTRWNEEKQEVEVYNKDNVFTYEPVPTPACRMPLRECSSGCGVAVTALRRAGVRSAIWRAPTLQIAPAAWKIAAHSLLLHTA
jgi:hypothetical protein